MRAVVQRVLSATVEVNGVIVGECGVGMLLLVAVHKADTEEHAKKLAQRIHGVRMFNDAEGKINLAISQIAGASILAVSNFTIYGDCFKSRRPSFSESAGYDQGRFLFDLFIAELRNIGVKVGTGEFGAEMTVRLANDGPVTLIIDA
ncbi:MAG: D-tyrosyl-tRNA(Tyr) deacylase [Armatimonadetes bacterium]|nr:D-tyrosyl-tRNA(Tyr) deacylase [Armatimonadota bacterium]